MILVLSGTHEGRAVIEQLKELNFPCTLSVTSTLGTQVYSDLNCPIFRGAFDIDSLTRWIQEKKVKIVIDATHPHAMEIKKTAQMACMSTKTPYFRLRRKMNQALYDLNYDNAQYYSSMNELLMVLKNELNVRNLLITGTKHIDLFYQSFDKSQCFFRVMPSRFSIDQCDLKQVPLSNIIAIKAPCPVSLNQALLKAYDISHFVFKESGEGSGYMNNLLAIKGLDVKGLVLKDIDQSINTDSRTYENVKDLILAIKKIML